MIDYSALRKKQIEEGVCPPWYTTGGIQLFYDKYSYNNETVKSRFRTVAQAMAKHAPEVYPEWWNTNPYWAGKTWEDAFFQTMWDGFISPSTPLLANGGLRQRGTTVSCAGGNVGNSLMDRYDFLTEAAILTKHSHGTSYCLDDWPAEGDKIRGGRSQGLMPLIRDIINVMEEVAQGPRRGSCAYSLRPQHGDFDKVADFLYERTESNNVGWLIDDEFVDWMNNEDPEALRKFAKMMGIKMPRGKGYYTFIDKMNRKLAKAFKRAGLRARASNLCQETNLPADDDYTFSCVILNYNLELYRSWPENLVFVGQVMSDCNISEYIETMETTLSKKDLRAMEKILRFTKEFRALGSGVLGFHTLLQTEMMSVSSMEAMMLNTKIFRGIHKDATLANSWLAVTLGEPEGCVGLGQRNATMLMMPPTKSTAELMAGASEGVGLDVAMCFTKQSAGGEFFRINKVLLKLIKEKELDLDQCVKDMNERKGSVQHVTWLTDEEKAVFRTAFEIPMEDHLRLCSQRQQWIDQGQSINLYFTSNDTPEYIGKIHRIAFNDPNILSLYYIYSMRGAGEITRVEICEVCQ
ncbi:ribonucleoside-diphosphate reductase [Pseudomonas phage COT4]|uniref:Ribonucleoside-diphosphate reductase n=1 Tax=Pseudomonas phage M5.1 TaxID=2873460 RepID=A0AAE9BPB4_9CAUD|nr:ribonucleotide-diphosphate reductase, alpha subunit [Pseudomonas phage M5.1]UAV89727.1 ribonucleotide-diphosphate reductase, alpha subunit [Pseudomonas phage M5.1]UGL61327.1 ribonucleoside-diphosphate reductase [Pseudomonas phage COT4]